MAQLSKDGKSEVKNQQVFKSPGNVGYQEGARMYKHGKSYYIFTDHPGGGQYMLKSNSPWGPYEMKAVKYIPSKLPLLLQPLQLITHLSTMMIIVNFISKMAATGGSSPNQGGLVDTPDGKWYFMSFSWIYPCGRTPTLAEVKWPADGYPEVVAQNGQWPKSAADPLPTKKVKSMIGSYTFDGPNLEPNFEWNHNPDTTKFSINKGLHLQTATVTKVS